MEQPECFVSGALGAFLRFSRFAGIAPLRFVKKGNGWRVSLSLNKSYIACFVMVISSLTLIWNLITSTLYISRVNIVRSWRGTQRVVWLIEVFMTIAVAARTVYSASQHMRCLITCLNQLQKINSELNVYHWPTQYNKCQIGFFILWMTVTLAVTIADFVVLFTAISLNGIGTLQKASIILYYIFFWIIQLDIIQLALVLLHVRSSFKVVNDSLNNLLQENTTKNTVYHDEVRRIAFAYASACDVVRDIDCSHGLKQLILLSVFFVSIVITPYYVITNILADLGELEYPFVIVFIWEQAIWCLLHVINLAILVEPCHLTHMEMQNTRELVGQLIRYTKSIYDPLAVELDKFCRVITINEVSYKPLMVTSMTRGLVFKILGSIATYLVMIVDLK